MFTISTDLSDLVRWIPSVQTKPVNGRLATMLETPGPFASVYLTVKGNVDEWGATVADRSARACDALAVQGAPAEVVGRVSDALTGQHPHWAESVTVVASADGEMLVEHDYRPPMRSLATWAGVPVVDQLLEWHQRRTPTLIVELKGDRADVCSYAVPGFDRGLAIRHQPADMAMVLAHLAERANAQLVIISGLEMEVSPLLSAVKEQMAGACRVVGERQPANRGELAKIAMRHVGFHSAEDTLRCLREQRFLTSVRMGVEGTPETVVALQSGLAKSLIVSDSAWSEQKLWVGRRSDQISLVDGPSTPLEVRLPDGLIRSALLQGIDIEIRWAFGAIRPRDGLAALIDTSDSADVLDQQLSVLA